jgi:hypothetical protein
MNIISFKKKRVIIPLYTAAVCFMVYFKAIYQFPKHIIVLVKIVANAFLKISVKVFDVLTP